MHFVFQDLQVYNISKQFKRMEMKEKKYPFFAKSFKLIYIWLGFRWVCYGEKSLKCLIISHNRS